MILNLNVLCRECGGNLIADDANAVHVGDELDLYCVRGLAVTKIIKNVAYDSETGIMDVVFEHVRGVQELEPVEVWRWAVKQSRQQSRQS